MSMNRIETDHPLTDRQAIGRILLVWRKRAPALIFGVLLAVAALLCGLALMRSTGLRLAGATVGLVVAGSSVLGVLGGLRVFFRYAERLFAHGAMFRALADLRVWFFRRLAKGSAAGLGFRRSGELLSRLVSDVEALDGLYLRVLLPVVSACIVLPVLFFALAKYSVLVAGGVAVLFVFAAFIFPAMAMKISQRDGGEQLRALAALRVAVLDMTSGIREIRAFGAGHRVVEDIRTVDDQLLMAQSRLMRRSVIAGALSQLCGCLAVLLLLCAAVWGRSIHMSPVVAVGLVFLVIAGFESISGLTRAGVLAGTMGAAARRITASAGHDDQNGSMANAVGHESVPPQGFDICFEDVGFRWTRNGPAVLKGISFEIPAGAHVVLLGESGAGKSSCAALLLRVASPESGRILLGGVDISSLPETIVRQKIAWLSQATHLFDDTIRANLLLGRPDADEAALWKALDDAAVGDVVRELPEGLDTWLGEGGVRVSGGQGRRIALARTLLSEAPVLILDEPATGLDSETEQDFLRTLNNISGKRTVILIAHRLTGVETPDYVWRISDGRAESVSQ